MAINVSVSPSSCVTPAGTSNELDVQNGWEENTHTHTHSQPYPLIYAVANPIRGAEQENIRGTSTRAPRIFLGMVEARFTV